MHQGDHISEWDTPSQGGHQTNRGSSHFQLHPDEDRKLPRSNPSIKQGGCWVERADSEHYSEFALVSATLATFRPSSELTRSGMRKTVACFGPARVPNKIGYVGGHLDRLQERDLLFLPSISSDPSNESKGC